MLQENAIADAGPGERSHRPNRGACPAVDEQLHDSIL
jgi:hypothetical protein